MSASETKNSSGDTLSSWRLTQVFGGDKAPGEEIPDADIVSSLCFDDSGNFLAAGDAGGRVVVFQRSDTTKPSSEEIIDADADPKKRKKHKLKAEYRFYAEFQSHEAEFDCLKSMEIPEKINQMKFLPRFNSSLMLLTTNEKTIKLWKMSRRNVYQALSPVDEPGVVTLPKFEVVQETIAADPKVIFDGAHQYHINSISLSSDQETFLSSDDLRIILWPLNSAEEGFNIVDIKPDNLDDLTMVITSTSFSPTDSSQFSYATSKGSIHLCDLRCSPLCDTSVKNFEIKDDSYEKSFFSDIIKSISDLKYSQDGRYILTRDFMSLRLWDIAMESKPIKVVNIHGRYEDRLCEFYDNDSIFDKFECGLNYNATQMVTGSYSRRFGIYDVNSTEYADMIANRMQPSRSHRSNVKNTAEVHLEDTCEDVVYEQKVMHLALHPQLNILAVTSLNNLFIFS